MNDLVIALKITGDAASAKAALEETRRAQMEAFTSGREAADKAALAWKSAEAKAKGLAQAMKESGADQGQLAAKMADAVAEAGRAKAAYEGETAALARRRQALVENKAALDQLAASARQAQAAQASGPGSIIPADSGRVLPSSVAAEQARQQVQAVRQAYQDLGAAGVKAGADLSSSSDQARARVAEMVETINGARSATVKVTTAIGLMAVALAAVKAVSIARAAVGMVDDLTALNTRLKLVEGSSKGAESAMDGINRVARNSEAPFMDAAKAYMHYARAIYSIGGDQAKALEFTEAIALALRLSGNNAQETGTAMLDLGQVMEKGSMDAAKFAALNDRGGKVIDYLAKSLGVSRVKLQEMSESGKLTADKLSKITDVLADIRKEADGLPKTVGAAISDLTRQVARWIEKSGSAKSVTSALVEVIRFLGDNLESIAWTGATIGIVALVANLAKLGTALRAVGIALGLLQLTPVGLFITGLAVAFSWYAGQAQAAADATDHASRKFEENATRARAAAGALYGNAKVAADAIKQSFDAAAKKSEELAHKVTDHAKLASDNAKQQYDARLRVIEDHYAQAERALENNVARERDRIQQGAALVAQAEGEKLAATRSWATEAERLSLHTNAEVVRLAQAAGRDVAQAQRDGLQEQIAIYGQVESAYRSTIDRLIREEQRHLQAAREAEEARYMLKLSVEDRIRALRQKAMDDVAAYHDREQQIQEKQALAQAELTKGNFSEAKRIAEETMALAERNSTAVTKTVEENGKNVTQTVVSQSAASSRAIRDIEAAAKIVDGALQGVGRTQANAAKTVGDAAKEATDGLNATLVKLEQLRSAMGQSIAVTMKVDNAEVLKAINELGALAEAKAITVRLKVNADALNEALAAMERSPEKVGELAIHARVKLDAVAADMVRLQTLASEQKLELPAELKSDVISKNIASLREALAQPTTATHTPVVDLAGYRQAVSELQQPTSSVHTVFVRAVEQHSIGGLVGAGIAAANLPRFATGGALPGYGGGDRIHAMLEAGEFIMRKEAVRRYGLAAMMDINAMRVPLPAFAVGGLAGAVAPALATSSGSRDVVDINLHLPGADTPVRVSAERSEAELLVQELNRMARVA